LKRELSKITVREYIKTVVDKKYTNKAELRVFARKYNEEYVYIQIRVEAIYQVVLVISFHFSSCFISTDEFPYYSEVR